MNPFPENPDAVPATHSQLTPAIPVGLPAEPVSAPLRDPVWSGWDVLRILLMALVAMLATVLVLLGIVPGHTLRERASHLNALPELQILGQMVAYLVLLGYMYVLVTKERRSPRFWQSIHWSWPATTWSYLLGGMVLQGAFLLVERFLPFPRDTPFEALLRRPYSVYLIAVFSVTLGPLMEELFFRGFLFPVLARRFGVATGILTSALGFALMHATQYGYSWASVLLILVVGIVLGTVRARQNSVAAAFLVHVAYNGTIILIMLIATGGFRHLERLGQ